MLGLCWAPKAGESVRLNVRLSLSPLPPPWPCPLPCCGHPGTTLRSLQGSCSLQPQSQARQASPHQSETWQGEAPTQKMPCFQTETFHCRGNDISLSHTHVGMQPPTHEHAKAGEAVVTTEGQRLDSDSDPKRKTSPSMRMELCWSLAPCSPADTNTKRL